MPETLVKIPKAEYLQLLRIRTAFEDAAKKVAYETGRFIWEDVPTESTKLYKPAFIRSLQRSLKQAEKGKLKKFRRVSHHGK